MRLAAFAGLLTLASVVQVHAAVTLNFDNLTGVTNPSNGAHVPSASDLYFDYYQSAYGLRISSLSLSLVGWVDVAVINRGASGTTSPPNAIVGMDGDTLNYASPLFFSFWSSLSPDVPATTNFFSVRDVIGGGSQITMYAFDVHDNLLGSDTKVDQGGTTWSISVPGIQTVRFGHPSFPANGGIALDDVTFNPISVPEPASLLLMSGMSLVLMRRRHLIHSCIFTKN